MKIKLIQFIPNSTIKTNKRSRVITHKILCAQASAEQDNKIPIRNDGGERERESDDEHKPVLTGPENPKGPVFIAPPMNTPCNTKSDDSSYN